MGGILLCTTNVFNKTYTSIWSVSWLSTVQWHVFSSLSASLAHFFLVLSFHLYYNQFLFFHLSPHSHVLHCLTKNSCGKVKHPEKFSYEENIKKSLVVHLVLFLSVSPHCCFLIDFDSDLPVTSSKPIPRMKHTAGCVTGWMAQNLKKKRKEQEKG